MGISVRYRLDPGLQNEHADMFFDPRGGDGFVDIRHPLFPEVMPEEINPVSISSHDIRTCIRELAGNPGLREESDSVLFTMRDAGRYAELLYCLGDPKTGEAWSGILLGDLANAAARRAVQRKLPRMNLSFNHRIPPDPPDYGRLKAMRAYNPGIDSEEGRAELISEIAEQAKRLSAEELGLLPEIIRLGKVAVHLLIDRHILLVYMTILKMKGAPWDERFAAGHEGLVKAVHSYSELPGFAFSTFAAKTIGGAILKAAHRERAASLGATPAQLAGANKMRRAEDRLTQQYGRKPTDQELTAATRMKPSTLVFYREILARTPSRLSPYDASEDRMPEVGERLGHKPLYPVETNQTNEQEYRQGLLQKAYTVAGLTPNERRLMQRMMKNIQDEVPGTPAEQRQFQKARRKILASAAAVQILNEFLTGD